MEPLFAKQSLHYGDVTIKSVHVFLMLESKGETAFTVKSFLVLYEINLSENSDNLKIIHCRVFSVLKHVKQISF
jgi:hypothetical protein